MGIDFCFSCQQLNSVELFMSFFSIRVTSKDKSKVLAYFVDNIWVKYPACVNLYCDNKFINTILT